MAERGLAASDVAFAKYRAATNDDNRTMTDNKDHSSPPNGGGRPGIDSDLGAGTGETITCESSWKGAAAGAGYSVNSQQNNNDNRDNDIKRLESKLDALLLALDVDPDSVGGDD